MVTKRHLPNKIPLYPDTSPSPERLSTHQYTLEILKESVSPGTGVFYGLLGLVIYV